MAVPRQVEEQLKAAEEKQKQLEADLAKQQNAEPSESPASDDAAPEQQEATEPTPEEGVAQSDTSADPGQSDSSKPDLDQQATPDTQTTAMPDAEFVKLQAAHKTLQGKYNAETRNQLDRIRELEQQNAAIMRLLQEQRAPREPDAPQPSGDGEPSAGDRQLVASMYSAEDVDSLGFETCLAHAKAAQRLVEQRITPVAQSTQQMQRARFENDLTQLCPQWQDLNDFGKTPGFRDYLNEVDPSSGLVRNNLFVGAAQRGDARTVAHHFNAYLSQQQQPPQQEPDPAAKPVTKPSVAAQVAPAKAKSQSGSTPTGKVYQKSDLPRLYAEIARLPAEKAEEALKDIEKAAMEGRIR